MDSLPTELHIELLKYLQLRDLKTLRIVSYKWEALTTKFLQKSNKICIKINQKEKLINFFEIFPKASDLPSRNIQFVDSVLSDLSLRDKVEEFAKKYGKVITNYSLQGGYFLPCSNHATLIIRECLWLNICTVITHAAENLSKLNVHTHYEMGPRGLPVFPNLRHVDITYTIQRFEFFDQTFISELATKVPRIQSFGILNNLKGANQDNHYSRKLPRIVKSLLEINPNVLLRLSFRIFNLEIPFLQEIFSTAMPLPRVSELIIKPFFGESKKEGGKDFMRVTLPNWLLLHTGTIIKLDLGVCTTPKNAHLALPEMPHLQELDIRNRFSEISLTKFEPNKYPCLKKLAINIKSIPWECAVPTVSELALYSEEDEDADEQIGKKLLLMFPKIEALTISCKSILLRLAFGFYKLRTLKIRDDSTDDDDTDHWETLTGNMEPIHFGDICKPVVADPSRDLTSFKNLKCLQRLEVVPCSLECVAALIYLSMMGHIIRLKRLILRFYDERKNEIGMNRPAKHFIEELRLRHEQVDVLDCGKRYDLC